MKLGCYRLLSIDPGSEVTGWALWENAVLYGCGVSKAPKGCTSLEARTRYHVQYMKLVLVERDIENLPILRVCERMTARGKFSIVDAQDLIDLNLVAGALGECWVTPAEWKGSVPRAVEQDRTRNALNHNELKLLDPYNPKKGIGHNAWSAVGIGLSVLGRAHVGKKKGPLL